MPGTEDLDPTPPARSIHVDDIDVGRFDAVDQARRPTEELVLDVKSVGGLIEEAKAHAIKWDSTTRWMFALSIAAVFIVLNLAVMWFTHLAFITDTELMRAPLSLKPADRLVTTQVILSLIGSTVVQTGIAVVAIVGYLFPKRVQAADD